MQSSSIVLLNNEVSAVPIHGTVSRVSNRFGTFREVSFPIVFFEHKLDLAFTCYLRLLRHHTIFGFGF
jgi:hypothetical protein